MFETCLMKQSDLIQRFEICQNDQDRYQLIIKMGRALKPFPAHLKTPDNLVSGCQSQTFLHCQLAEGKLQFEAGSDALISAGLTALLLFVYNDEAPKTVLTCSADFLGKLDLMRYLTPSRSNGLFSVHLRMKKEALRLISQSNQL